MSDAVELKRQFDANEIWGVLASVDLHRCDLAKMKSAEHIKNFVYVLCKKIDVNRFGDCVVVHFGKEERVSGFSMTQLIETSLVSGHFADESSRIFLDVFSCKFFDPNVVAAYASEYFGASDFTLTVLPRK